MAELVIGSGLVNNVCKVSPDSNWDGVLAAVDVVAPPPPSAPDAKADAATSSGEPVTVDVLTNDVANANAAIDAASLAVVAQGTKGNAVVAGGKIVYTPNAGAVGVDTLRYKVCSAPVATTTTSVDPTTSTTAPVPPGGACDEAAVTITINRVAAAAHTDTTAAPVSTNELPRTGSSSGTTFVALGVLVAGCALLATTRQRRSRKNA